MNAVAAVLAQHSLLDYIPESANLREVGRDRYRGKCPIGDHAQGAFSVFRHADGHFAFYCFGCGAQGSVIDMFAAINGLTTRDAIKSLSTGIEFASVSPESIIAKHADRYFDRQPKFGAFTCAKPACPSWIGFDSALDYAVFCANGSVWEVAPDGIAGICEKH